MKVPVKVPLVAPSAAPAPMPAVARPRRAAPLPQPDSGGPNMVKTGRGVVPQKPHNPDNQLAAMPSAAGYRNGGMVKGK